MRDLLKIAIPDKTDIIAFSLIGFVALIAVNAQRMLLLLSGVSGQDVNNALSLDARFSQFIMGFEADLDPRIVDISVWMFVGLATFLVLSFLIGWWHSVREEASMVEYYRHPKNYHAGHEINAFLARGGVRMFGAIGLVFWTFIFFGTISHELSSIFVAAITNLNDLPLTVWVLLTPILYGAGLYIFAILFRMITLRARVFG